jgi:protein-L-isoaspartate O-methyltransferase
MRSRFYAHIGLSLAFLLAISAAAPPAAAQPKAPDAGPYVPTPYLIAERMLALANVGPEDYVIDLGSGDGRLVMAAVTKFKARGAAGIELDEDLVRRATLQSQGAGVADRVTFTAGDLFKANIARATVITAYLLPHIMGEVEAKLARELKPGARVVCHDYPLPTWKPVDVVTFESPDKVAISGTARTVLYLYRVPGK